MKGREKKADQLKTSGFEEFMGMSSPGFPFPKGLVSLDKGPGRRTGYQDRRILKQLLLYLSQTPKENCDPTFTLSAKAEWGT